MAANFAAGHVLGHAAGLAEGTNSTMAADVRDDSAVLSKSSITLDGTPSKEARFILHVAQDTIDEFLPALLWLTLIISVTVVFTWGLVRCCALASRQWNLPEHWTRMLRYAFAALLLFFGFTLAFGAVGVNFGSLFFGLSIVTASSILSVSNLIQSLVDGARLASLRVLTGHHTVVVSAYGLEGEIISLGIFTSEMRPIVEQKGDDDRVERRYADQTVILDNRLILNGPLYVKWHDIRPTTRPQRSSAMATARRDVERHRSVVDEFVAPTTERFGSAAVSEHMTARDRARQRMLAMYSPTAMAGSGSASVGKMTHRQTSATAAAAASKRLPPSIAY